MTAQNSAVLKMFATWNNRKSHCRKFDREKMFVEDSYLNSRKQTPPGNPRTQLTRLKIQLSTKRQGRTHSASIQDATPIK